MIERVNNPIPTPELERRWAAVRASMADAGIDVLLIQGNNDFMGGYVKYLTDLPATNGYPVSVVFPRDERMTVVGQGALGMVQEFAEGSGGLRRGVARYLGTPMYATVPYTTRYESELVIKALAPYASGTIGIVGKGVMSAALLDDVRAALPNARLPEASELVDRIKVPKSAIEIEQMRKTAALQDVAWQAVLRDIRPGMREIEVAGIAEFACRQLGSEQGLYMCAAGRVGDSSIIGNRHLQNRVLAEGDYIALLIESNGPGGYYTELGRTLVLGKASQEMHDEHAIVLEARRFMLDRLVPGASGPQIWEDYNAFLRSRGRPAERRLHCHGQGYDMVERPLVRHDESMLLAADMVLACHPTYATARTFSWTCENYLVRDGAAPECLHATPDHLFELG